MKRIIIIFLFIIFSSNFSLANNNKKITVEEIESIFNNKRYTDSVPIGYYEIKETGAYYEKENKRGYTSRFRELTKYRNIANCAYDGSTGENQKKRCLIKIIKTVLSGTERGKAKFPGNIFYAFDAMERLIYYDFKKNKKNYLKKIEKFKKNPSNEKELGYKLINYIKKVRTMQDIRTKTVANGSFVLFGDMLNANVKEVSKRFKSSGIANREKLLKKYLSILDNTKYNLKEENYKSIDNNVSKLKKTYENLNTLNNDEKRIRYWETVSNVDGAIDIMFDVNKFIQINISKANQSQEQKLLALASINLMQHLTESILSIIPKKYSASSQELSKNLFETNEFNDFKVIINNINKNNVNECKKLATDISLINKYIDLSDIEIKLQNLKIKNNQCKSFKPRDITKIADLKLIDKKWKREILSNANFLKDVSREASKIVSSISSDPTMSSATSNNDGSGSILDRKFGEVTVRQLIGASRR